MTIPRIRIRRVNRLGARAELHTRPSRSSELALSALHKLRIPSDGFRSKSWDEFARPDAPALDFVFTVCDKAAGEVCPVWPGQPMTAHWGVPDPAAVEGSDEQKAKAVMDVAITLKRRIELMLSLPMNTLAGMALQRELDQIGKAGPRGRTDSNRCCEAVIGS